MADTKISALSASTTPLAGTEVLPIVQSGATKKVSVANLTAGRAVSVAGLTDTSNSRIVGNTTGTDYNNASLILGEDAFGATVLGIGNNAAGNYSYLQAVKIGNQYNKLKLNPNGGNVEVPVDNLVIGTAGKGIDFSANGGTVLTQYAEGTWTPAQGPDVTVVGTYSSSGRYTRIGRQVTVTVKMQGSTSIACTAFGRLITDLPFTADGDGVGSMWVEGVSTAQVALAGTGTKFVYATAAFGAPATVIVFTITYFV